MLADGVQLADGGAGGQEEPRDLLLLRERDRGRRRGRQGRAAPGDEEQREIVLAGAAGELEQPRRGVEPPLVGHRMARLRDRGALQAHAVAILDDDEAAGDAVADALLGGGGHGAARLATAQDEDACVAGIDPEMTAHERHHIARGESRLPDGARCLARRHEPSLRRRSPASRSMSSVFGKQNRIFVRPSSGWA